MRHDRIGLRHEAQVAPTMPGLPTRLLAARRAQALRLAHRADQPIARRRLAAVVTILGQPAFQVLHTCHQRLQLLPQRGVLGLEGDVLVLQFLARHNPSLPTPATPT